MRLFGNVLGNCIYDKNYCGKVMKMAKPPVSCRSSAFRRNLTLLLP
jgi:recombination DNA repair RAD52 pathway protein